MAEAVCDANPDGSGHCFHVREHLFQGNERIARQWCCWCGEMAQVRYRRSRAHGTKATEWVPSAYMYGTPWMDAPTWESDDDWEVVE